MVELDQLLWLASVIQNSQGLSSSAVMDELQDTQGVLSADACYICLMRPCLSLLVMLSMF